MSSEKQIAANQANAQKSAGPATAAGLEKSSRNATRHGLLARTIVLDRECQERFILLLATMHEEFEPATVVECDLVENMAIARWRLLRLWGIEKAGFDAEMQKHQSEPGAAFTAALAFRALSDETRSLDLMSRYETRFERLYARSLDRLIKLREKRVFAKRTQFLDQ